MKVDENKKIMIGICGGSWKNSGVGKTTVANILAKNFGFHPVSFIDPVKDIAKRMYGWDGIMDDNAKVTLDRICRTGREISEHYWRDMAIIRIPADKKRIVFDDVYFDNEFRVIVENGGIILKVVKKGFETPIIPCMTVEINNDGTLQDLQRSVLLAVNEALPMVL